MATTKVEQKAQENALALAKLLKRWYPSLLQNFEPIVGQFEWQPMLRDSGRDKITVDVYYAASLDDTRYASTHMIDGIHPYVDISCPLFNDLLSSIVGDSLHRTFNTTSFLPRKHRVPNNSIPERESLLLSKASISFEKFNDKYLQALDLTITQLAQFKSLEDVYKFCESTCFVDDTPSLFCFSESYNSFLIRLFLKAYCGAKDFEDFAAFCLGYMHDKFYNSSLYRKYTFKKELDAFDPDNEYDIPILEDWDFYQDFQIDMSRLKAGIELFRDKFIVNRPSNLPTIDVPPGLYEKPYLYRLKEEKRILPSPATVLEVLLQMAQDETPAKPTEAQRQLLEKKKLIAQMEFEFTRKRLEFIEQEINRLEQH
jgi:hypothetical protein